MTLRMTYGDFVSFVKKREDTRKEFGKRWFKFDSDDGAVFIDPNGNANRNGKPISKRWVYDGYIPYYAGRAYVGFGTYKKINAKRLSVPSPVYGDGVEMVILTDVYGDMTYDDGSEIE